MHLRQSSRFIQSCAVPELSINRPGTLLPRPIRSAFQLNGGASFLLYALVTIFKTRLFREIEFFLYLKIAARVLYVPSEVQGSLHSGKVQTILHYTPSLDWWRFMRQVVRLTVSVIKPSIRLLASTAGKRLNPLILPKH